MVLLILNLPLIRKSVFGRIALDPKKSTWTKIESVKYHDNYLDILYPDIQKLGLTEPKGIVLFAHGGGWISGYRRQPNNVSWYRYLVGKGFLVAAIDYSRGYKAGIEKLIDELIKAVEFLKQKFKYENYEISLMGLSAGGHLALLTASRVPEDVKRVVAYYSPCDLIDIWNSTSLFARLAVATTLKRLPSKSKSIYEKYSPVNHITSKFPSVLLVHGLRDSIVPYTSSVKMHKGLRKHKIKSKLLLHPYGDHGFEFVLRDKKTVDIIEKTSLFLEGKEW